jgi:NAD(P)H-flavin reductase
MWILHAILTRKEKLTHDVFELEYELSEEKTMKAWQFITFIIPWVWGRSYSVLTLEWKKAILIIKKWETQNGGRWWSIYLCDAQVWDEFKTVWPVGHFILQENLGNKLFLWTWTWLVPLYSQIVEWLSQKSWDIYQLVFWVRYMKDMYYQWKFQKLKEEYPNTFYYHLVVSRDEAHQIIHKWYVTDFLSRKVASNYQEYYICGAPWMIEGCQKRLEELWVKEENIYFEKYA